LRVLARGAGHTVMRLPRLRREPLDSL
jgi:hypothetical protein